MNKAPKPSVDIFADGACSGNPGVGGFGAILRCNGKEKEISGAEEATTNNRMELLAIITALAALKGPCHVSITTDSNYIVKGMTEWLPVWVKNGWRNSQKKGVLNRDLWEKLLKACAPHDIPARNWKWIKGHSGHAENERCDKLARDAIKKLKAISKK